MRKRMPLLVSGIAAALFALPGIASAQVVAIDSMVTITATANAGLGDVSATATDQWGPLLSFIGAGASATANNGQAIVTAHGFVSATWLGADAGTTTLTNVGWDTQDVANGGAFVWGVNWTYTFLAMSGGTFTMAYDVTAAGTDLFGLDGIVMNLVGPSLNASYAVGNAFDPSGSGSWSEALVAGDTYTVSVTNWANIVGWLGTRTASMNGTLRWSIDGNGPGVPEPGALALGGSLLAAFGWSLRRRRAE